MKTIPANLAGVLSAEAPSTALCLVLERGDGLRLGFTSHDEPLTVDGVACEPQSGFDAATVQFRADLRPDSLGAELVLDSEAVSERDLRAGLWDDARLSLWLVDWSAADPGADALLLAGGWRLAEVATDDQGFSAEVVSLAGMLERTVGRTYGRRCPLVFGSAQCGFDAAGAEVAGTVTSSESIFVFTDENRSEADGTFDDGRVEFSSGANAPANGGWAVDVESASGGRIVCKSQLRVQPSPGDTYVIRPGCDKQLETCRDRFANLDNFRGYGVFCPGRDSLMRYPI